MSNINTTKHVMEIISGVNVNVWQRPYSHEKFEGVATVKKVFEKINGDFDNQGNPFYDCMVTFIDDIADYGDDAQVVRRKVSVVHQ